MWRALKAHAKIDGGKNSAAMYERRGHFCLIAPVVRQLDPAMTGLSRKMLSRDCYNSVSDENPTLGIGTMTDQPLTFEGKCTCGEVRYRMTGRPLFVHCCHCRWCQRETGSAFALKAMIEADRVELLSGSPEIIDTPSNSGEGQKITRCPRCRIALWSNYAGAGNAVHFVLVGTLLEPDRLPPDIHIFTSSKQPWVVLPAGVPAVAEYYDRKKYWPEESNVRCEALLAKLKARGS